VVHLLFYSVPCFQLQLMSIRFWGEDWSRT